MRVEFILFCSSVKCLCFFFLTGDEKAAKGPAPAPAQPPGTNGMYYVSGELGPSGIEYRSSEYHFSLLMRISPSHRFEWIRELIFEAENLVLATDTDYDYRVVVFS